MNLVYFYKEVISLTYKNVSYVSRTFYGVEFKPGEIHDVKGFINDPAFVRVPEDNTSVKALAKPAEKPVQKADSTPEKKEASK